MPRRSASQAPASCSSRSTRSSTSRSRSSRGPRRDLRPNRCQARVTKRARKAHERRRPVWPSGVSGPRTGARHRCRGCDVSRAGGRRADQIRPLEIVPDYLEQPHGCVLFSQGKTRVLCTASVEEGVPRWMAGRGQGWITAEYSLLPASTGQRTQREASSGRQKGRTVEIQRLIGRAVRAVTDFAALGERTLWLDCDVLQADGGTRCAAISGAWVAARRALDRFGLVKAMPGSVAAVSLGIVGGELLLDLDYEEDSTADVDLNVVMTGDGRLVEVQATAERVPFGRDQLDELLELAARGIALIGAAQQEAVDAPRG